MEQVIDVYLRPYDPDNPVVCTDEASKQLIGDVREPLPPAPGEIQKEDSHYERQGTCNLFIAFEPLAGRRDITVTDRRTKIDWATYVKKIVDEMYPHAHRVTLVCDQLNTHNISSLYEAFPAQEAHRLANKIEIVHTPKHGSWLNMAEIEFSALARQCLNRRIPDKPALTRETTAWTTNRNRSNVGARWQFTTADARIKLASLYPKPLL
jgi:hypothetical protein